jgi:glycosyltransferase involved in cell wall biosynthesis
LPGLLDRLEVDAYLSPGSFLPLRWRGPQVLTVHDLNQLARPRNRGTGAEFWRWLDAVLNTPPAMQRATALVAVSAYAARSIRRFMPWIGSRVTVVPLAAAPGFGLDPGPAAAAEAAALTPAPYVLYVGEIAAHKNLARLLEGFAASGLAAAGTGLLLVGPDPGRYGSRLRQSVSELGIGAATRFPGVVSEPVLRALYRSAACVVMPSRHEGFGLPAVEAMATGTPVVAAAAGALPEVLGGAGVLFDGRDASDLGRRLHDVVAGDDRRAEMVARITARGAAFSWEVTAERTAQVIEGCAVRRRPR